MVTATDLLEAIAGEFVDEDDEKVTVEYREDGSLFGRRLDRHPACLQAPGSRTSTSLMMLTGIRRWPGSCYGAWGTCHGRARRWLSATSHTRSSHWTVITST